MGALSALRGYPVLFVATLLHPLQADPNDPRAAFAEYAADSLWVISHLGQFLGVALLATGLLALGETVDTAKAWAWARIDLLGTAASAAVTAALQAVDGVALKVMVDRWSQASGPDQMRSFETALAVRQVEIGMASMGSQLFGLTLSAFGVSLLFSQRYPAGFFLEELEAALLAVQSPAALIGLAHRAV
ncbi:MAG: hypothetical protein H0X69_08990 [Gemmatimonadales bacterium]|nr:hypothetical protein [Gemmatimonadales bacterium]